MIKILLKGISIFSLLAMSMLSFNITKTFASTVTISQTGNVVIASNGMLTFTYDLSIGKGNFNAGATK